MAHDPRGFARGYAAGLEGDVLALEDIKSDIRHGITPLPNIINDLDARNIPPQLWQNTFLAFIAEFGVKGAQLLIPSNPQRRFSFTVSNFTGANLVMFSYGKPLDAGALIGAGIPISPCFGETNGSVSVNDIWVFCNDSTATYPIPVLGYEGGISMAGNKR